MGIILCLPKIAFPKKIIANHLEEDALFTIEKDGLYAIWGQSKMHRINELARKRPVIYETKAGIPVTLKKPLLSIQVKNFGEGRAHLYTFYAKKGVYKLKISPTPYSFIYYFFSVSNLEPVTYQIRSKSSTRFVFLFWFFFCLFFISSMLGLFYFLEN